MTPLKQTNDSIDDYAKYYSNLFSHDDRPSNKNQLEIEKYVDEHYNSIKNVQFNEETFTYHGIERILKNLKIGKAIGVDFLSNEMFKYGACNNLILLLKIIFNTMIRTGHIPNDFNISLVTPIPKKDAPLSPSESRPISVSTSIALIYEALIKDKIDFISITSRNQFGYQNNTSCKHAYFVVNETINYYRHGKSAIHIASLDATKAFDKLWRGGLFYKLIPKIDAKLWRSIIAYYNQSKIIVKINNNRSNIYNTSQGCKQGGILSPYLFNFFVNDLLEEVIKLNIGCKLDNKNVSIIAYYDDILVMSPTAFHLNMILNHCHLYATFWKMEFNQKKSAYLSFEPFKKTKINAIKMNNSEIPKVDNIIYLGLPIGDDKFKEDFIKNNFKKCERAFYSLYGLGCKPYALNPKMIACLFKQFCQSIFKFGLENLFLSKQTLTNLNIRQNILIKRAIGISKYCKTKPLFQCLRVESVFQIYSKHKLFFYKQIKKNDLSKSMSI